MDARIAKPPPALLQRIDTDIWTAPFWESARRHELALPRCADCRRFRMPPTPFCPHCRSQTIDWSTRVEQGILYSYTIVDRAIFSGIEESLPYVPAIVSFPDADGVRLITNIVGSRIGDIMIGVPVTVGWTDLPSGLSLPIFHLSDGE